MTIIKECRLCLQKTTKYINLFEENFQQSIFELTSLEISEEDVLPKIACVICIAEIKQAIKTRTRILECHEKLLKLYKSELDINDETYTPKNFEEERDTFSRAQEKQMPTESFNEVVEIDHLLEKVEVKEDIGDMTLKDPDPLDLGNPSKNIETSDMDENDSHESISERVDDSKGEEISLGDIELEEIIDDKYYICNQCGQVFSQKNQDFHLHKLKHEKSKYEFSGVTTIRSVNMEKYIDPHTGLSSVCGLCGAICKNVESLRGHIYNMHKKSYDELKCDQCPKKFRRKDRLKEHHNKEHAGIRNYICHFCEKKFPTTTTLKSHIDMIHLKLRPHICEYCQKGFSSQYGLKTHIRQHTKETPYKCSVCGEGFRYNVSLRSHLKSKHNIEEDKKVPCKFCDKSFGSHMALKLHLAVHNDNNYKCSYCHECFNQKFFLLNHMKYSHDIDMVDV